MTWDNQSWFDQQKTKMDQEREAWSKEQDASLAARMKESRSRFLLESFKDVFLETLKMTAPPEGTELKRGDFDEMIDRCLSAAHTVVAGMKQLIVDSTTVLTSPAVSIEVEETAKLEQLKAAGYKVRPFTPPDDLDKIARSKQAGFTKEQLEQRPARKPPASDR